MSRRLRILQVFNRYRSYGGEEGSVYKIGDLLQRSHDVEYFFSSSSELSATPAARILAPVTAIHNRKIAARLMRFQSAGSFDLWQVHNIFPTMSPSVYDLAFQLGIPVIQYLHNYRMSCANGFFYQKGDLCTRCIGGNFTHAFRTACWQDSSLKSGVMGIALSRIRALKVFDKISAWVALSHAQKALHVQMGIPADRIRVIPHYHNARNLLPSGESADNVLFVGRLSEEKGVHVLLEAWKIANPGKAQLFIIGDGPERKNLVAQVERDSIKNVVFTGFVEKPAQLEIWKQCAFSVAPSVWVEPLGNVVFEAWDHGRPVIVSKLGGLAETVDDQVNGVHVKANNAPALAESILSMLALPKAKLAEMAESGRNKLRSVYTEDVWLSQMTEIYRQFGG